MKLCLHCRFTNGKKNFIVIGIEVHPQRHDKKNPYKFFYEFVEEGVQPPKPQMREAEYLNNLLREGKLNYL